MIKNIRHEYKLWQPEIGEIKRLVPSLENYKRLITNLDMPTYNDYEKFLPDFIQIFKQQTYYEIEY